MISPGTNEIRSAELGLMDYLTNRLKLEWPVASYSGIDRESGKPLITLYCSDWAAAQAWSVSQSEHWQGYRVLIVEDRGLATRRPVLLAAMNRRLATLDTVPPDDKDGTHTS